MVSKGKDDLAALKVFLNDTLKELMAILRAECGSLFIFDSDKGELILDSFSNSHQVCVKDIKRKMGEGIAGKVAQIKSPVLVSNIDNDLRFRRNGFTHYNTKSFISIPLFGEQRLIGLINLADKADGTAFSEQDLMFAVTLCKYVSFSCERFLQGSSFSDKIEAFDKQKETLEKYANVGKLAAGVVHQINNPLDGIIRYTNIVLSHASEHSATKEYLLEIKKGLSRIEGITKSLLEFSHIVNSNYSKAVKYVDVSTVIDEVLDMNKSRTANIAIVKNYDSENLRILDMGIIHVLMNIIKNAIDAMPQGGTLEIKTEASDSSVNISFKDSGVGIPDDVLEHIFKPFFTTKSIEKGTGLGLAICSEIVNKYTGKIAVNSLEGRGSTFSVLIPKKYFEYEHKS